jgi:hypothetical protein
MEPSNCGLKSVKLSAQIDLYSFKLAIPEFCPSDRKKKPNKIVVQQSPHPVLLPTISALAIIL